MSEQQTFDSEKIFQGLSKHIADLENQVKTLEAKAKEQEEMLRKLRLEVPMHGQVFERKLKRLSVPQIPITTPWPAKIVRQRFLDFFQSKGHTYWRSAPVVPINDPTLLFINSGMAQFKPLFLGQCDPNNDMSKLKRAHNSQKCIRAGGKHNDLDDVGKDSYHHTFFEMLGNWSFGDYFKKEAIDWAWELLTVEFKIDPSRLYATYFAGNERVPVDLEAKQFWEQYLPKNHVLPYGAKENFWEMGPTGPCGPCTEIHYDRIGNRDASALVNHDDPMVIEIWNLVFIQYNRNDAGTLEVLPSQHVDTGMGFERLVSVLQDKRGNYETDVWTPIFDAIGKLTKVGRPYSNKYGVDDPEYIDMAYRVVADHLRTVSFAIADGCEPSNEGRGYVVRRILRRAVRYGMDTLKCDKMFFSSLVPVLADHMNDVFPELKAKQDHVIAVIADEEKVFTRTIEKGRVFFEQKAQELLGKGVTVIPGADAFFMMASLGFPVDLTEIMAAEKKMTVNKVEYEEELKKHKELSGKTGMGDDLDSTMGIVPKLDAFATDALEKLAVQPTINEPGKLAFDASPGCKTRVVAIFDPSLNKFVDEVTGPGKTVGLVLERTNFYHEAGGQVGDTGVISTDEAGGATFQVYDTQSSKGFVVHAGVVQAGKFKVSLPVACLVDTNRRKRLACNHTSTHLLNFGLRDVLKRDVDQKGSLVNADKLRFDFDSREPITVEQIAQVEQVVRKEIAAKKPVHAKVVPLAQAKSIATLRAVFGETYPDPVRVVCVGIPVDDLVKDPVNDKWKSSSIELCGGSHMTNSADAQAFCIVQEEGIAKGIRRITAVTGQAAIDAHDTFVKLEAKVQAVEKNPTEESEKALRLEIESGAALGLCERLALKKRLDNVKTQLYEIVKKAEKEAIDVTTKRAMAALQNKNGGGVFIVDCGVLSEAVASKACGKVAMDVSKAKKASVVAICQTDSTFMLATCLIEGDVTGKITSDVLLKKVSEATGGKGGGDKSKGTMRGDIGKLPDALRVVKETLSKLFGGDVVEVRAG